jgi:uncharacterized membrane protein
MSIVAVFTIGERWKSQVFINGEWINKMYYIHTIEYYLAIKRYKLQIHSVTCMTLEAIVLMTKDRILYDYIYMKCPK